MFLNKVDRMNFQITTPRKMSVRNRSYSRSQKKHKLRNNHPPQEEFLVQKYPPKKRVNFIIRHNSTQQEESTKKKYSIQKELAKYLDKDFFRRRTFHDLVELFCNATTFHGPGHIWHNRRNLMGLLWLIVTLTLSVALVVVVAQYIINFTRRELLSQSTLRDGDSTGLQLPSIVVCNRSYFSKKKLEELGINSRVSSYMAVILGTAFIGKTTFLSTSEGLKLIADVDRELQELLDHYNYTLEELVDRVSYQCDELIIGCRLGIVKVPGQGCCKHLRGIHTTLGKCYFLPAGERVKQTTNGESSGYAFFLRTYPGDEPDLYTDITDLTTILKRGLQVTLTSNITHPGMLVSGRGTMIIPGSLLSMEASLTWTDMSRVKGTVDISEMDCVLQDRLSWDDPESILRLMPNSFFKMTRECTHELCKCSLYGLHSQKETRRCTAIELMICYGYIYDILPLLNVTDENGDLLHSVQKFIRFRTTTKEFQECKARVQKETLRICQTMSFSCISTIYPIQQEHLELVGDNLGINDSTNLAAVTVYYPDLIYSHVAIWRLGMSHLISELGGYMGLFLGSSLISYIEIATFACLAITMAFRRRRRKAKDSPG